MYPTMALLQQQITSTSQSEKCINKESNNEIIEKLTGLIEQIAGNLGDYVEVENNEANKENANKNDNPRKLVKKKRTDITYAQLFQAAPNIRKDMFREECELMIRDGNKKIKIPTEYCKPAKIGEPIKKKNKNKIASSPESSDSEETDDEEEWETEENEEYQEEHLINKTYLYQEIYDENNNFSNEYYFENHTNDTKKIEDKNFNLVKENILYQKLYDELTRPLRVIKLEKIEIVLKSMHKNPIVGHFGEKATTYRIRKRFYWPLIKNDIKSFVKECNICQERGKPRAHKLLNPVIVGQLFERISIDFVGPLPLTKQGNKYLIVATKYLTKWLEARAIPNCTAETATSFLCDNIICRHKCSHD
ncbi:3238_t:CDS:2 [Gigaspora margarita]|uniref:3238_t:CDS:1 n=1 Tax=Gigaspora margarita TaxID=4874 RepID=A0ABN7UR00_GIGMA|nr:3238_t:CDS:2 [Gigaspora margarita]